MDTLKSILQNRYKIISLLSASMVLSIILLMIRIKLTHSFFYLFLVWNLFLAIIPYAISVYLINKEKLSKIKLLIWFSIWLLFLPNAPYIITDLLHLRLSDKHFMWLDVLVVTSFAYNGLIIFFLSVLDMETVLKKYLKPKKLFYFIVFVVFLTGFGMYLGRFLRYNSWEIIQNPFNLFSDVFDIILNPNQHIEAWIFTLTLGAFLSIGFWMFKAVLKIE